MRQRAVRMDGCADASVAEVAIINVHLKKPAVAGQVAVMLQVTAGRNGKGDERTPTSLGALPRYKCVGRP